MMILSSLSLLIIVGIFTLCVVATIRTKSAWPLAALGVVVLAGIAFLTVANVSRAPQVRMTSAIEHIPPREQPSYVGRVSDAAYGTTSWDSIDTNQFRTNIFPSVASAARDLAKQVPTILDEMHGNSNDVTKLILQATFTQTVPQKGQNGFQEELLKQLPNVTFDIVKAADQTKENVEDTIKPTTVEIELGLKAVASTTAAWDANEKSETGTLSCAVHSIQGSRSISVDYIEKPWIEQLDQFSNGYPSRAFAVGVSPTLCESPEAANRSAIESLKAIETHAAINGVRVGTPVDESLVIDRFVQKLERPYGDVWREAVLVDYKSPQAEAIRTRMLAHLQAETQRYRAQASQSWFHGLILIAVFGATAVVGMVLNLVTEGYFRGKIAATVVAFAVAAFLAFFLRMPSW